MKYRSDADKKNADEVLPGNSMKYIISMVMYTKQFYPEITKQYQLCLVILQYLRNAFPLPSIIRDNLFSIYVEPYNTCVKKYGQLQPHTKQLRLG